MPEETVAVFLTATTCFSRHNFCHIAVLSVSFCCTDIQQQQVFFFHIQHLGHPIRRIPVGFRCFPLQPLTGIVFSKRDIPLKRIFHDPVFTHRKFTVTSFHRFFSCKIMGADSDRLRLQGFFGYPKGDAPLCCPEPVSVFVAFHGFHRTDIFTTG